MNIGMKIIEEIFLYFFDNKNLQISLYLPKKLLMTLKKNTIFSQINYNKFLFIFILYEFFITFTYTIKLRTLKQFQNKIFEPQ